METNIHEKLKALPQPIYQAFMADDVLCEEACMLYGLPEEKLSSVSGPIGALFVGDMKLADYPREIASKSGVEEAVAYGIAYEINKRFFLKFPEQFVDAPLLQKEWEGKKKPPIIGEREAQEKAAKLKPWLFEKSEEEAEQEKVVEESHAKLSLLAALGKYARLGEQAITSSRLTLKGNPEPVRGSLVNWLKVYRDELGVGYHDPVLRAKFLFNSPNAKNISSEERERLNLILRSVEENAPLDIDLSKMEIIFPSFSVTEQHASPKPAIPGLTRNPENPNQAGPDSRLRGNDSGRGGNDNAGSAAPFSTASVSAAPSKPAAGMQSTPVLSAPVAPTPTPAPKRQGMFSSAFTIRPTGSGTQSPSVTSQTPSAPATGQAPTPMQGGFRFGKGMHFTGLEPKPTAPAPAAPAPVAPKPATQQQSTGGGFSFSSKHSFPAEHSEEGGMSINRPSGEVLPSGQALFRGNPSVSAPSAPQPPKPVAPKMSPFQIRPVSLHKKMSDDDMGRIVDLRNE